jgi:hypothetical protein
LTILIEALIIAAHMKKLPAKIFTIILTSAAIVLSLVALRALTSDGLRPPGNVQVRNAESHGTQPAIANEFDRTLSHASTMFRVTYREIKFPAIERLRAEKDQLSKISVSILANAQGAKETAPTTNPQQAGYASAQDLKTVAHNTAANAQGAKETAPTTNPQQAGYARAQDLKTVAHSIAANAQGAKETAPTTNPQQAGYARAQDFEKLAVSLN